MNRSFIFACASCIAALATGTVVLLSFGAEPPDWLVRVEIACFSVAGLICGFTAISASAPPWLWSRSILGSICIWIGLALPWVPSQFIGSGFFMGFGLRMLWAATWQLSLPGTMPAGGLKAFVGEELFGQPKAARHLEPDDRPATPAPVNRNGVR